MQRRNFLIGAGAATAAAIGAGALAFDARKGGAAVRRYGGVAIQRRPPSPDAPDVLFIALDDCNDWIGFLANHPGTVTPNLDALAAESLVFEHAYCTAPLCHPARASVMFGRTPWETGIYDHSDASQANYRELARSSASLVDYFWGAGYDVDGAGKVFGDPQSDRWTQLKRVPLDPPNPAWLSPYDGRPIGSSPRGPVDFGPTGQTPDQGPDGVTGTWVRQQLAAPRVRPLFLGYGLISTHVGWRVPQKYFDLHPIEDVVVPEYRPDDLDDVPRAGRELVDQRPLDELREAGLWEEAVQAYQAAMSYADDRVGTVLDALASSPRGDGTIVVLWSDHGFHLGEKLHWHKQTLWERATRIPMLVRIPAQSLSGVTFDPPVSALDIAPTLADAAGIDLDDGFRGRSLLPAVAQPSLADDRPAMSTWLPGNHSVRRGPWRYIRYRSGEAELYDHRTEADEYTNLAGKPEYGDVERELAAFLPALTDEKDPQMATSGGSNDD